MAHSVVEMMNDDANASNLIHDLILIIRCVM